MLGSTFLYAGLVMFVAGLLLAIKPVARLRVPTRRRALAVAAAGGLIGGAAAFAPVFDSRVETPSSRLDQFAPAWQFREVHTRRVKASPARVFEAIRHVRADDILLFRTLTWIRRAGQPAPPGILNPDAQESILSVATRGGFIILADEPPRELVLGIVVVAPRSARGSIVPTWFLEPPRARFALGTMNFLVTPDGPDASIVTTETRVAAGDPAVRRRFAIYWRLIYPGSALIRRMWLRAIDLRATSPG